MIKKSDSKTISIATTSILGQPPEQRKQPPIAHRMEQIAPFYVMELLSRARELEAAGRDIIHMEVGEPDFVTPAPIIAAARQSLADGQTHYTPATGIPELRKAIAAYYLKRYGLSVDYARIIVTPGASGALQLVMNVAINPGEVVLIADPGYPCNRHFVQLVGGEPVTIPVGPDSNFQLDAASVAAAWTEKTRAVIVATPSNPTGTLLSTAQLRAIYDVVKHRSGILIVDEIYQGLVYDAEQFSALEISRDLFVINSFSKYFGMTGWRLGWLIAPERYIDALTRLAQNIFISPQTTAQYAALAAFSKETTSILEARRVQYKARKEYLISALRGLGFDIPVTPKGALYLYADCSLFSDDSYKFAMCLLEEAGVAVTPGRDFGFNAPERHLRFAYTTEIAGLEEGVERIRRFLNI